MTILRRIGLKCAHQPGNNHLFENDGIRPYLHLPPEVAALRIDPGCLRDVPFIEKQINVGDRNLRVEHPGQDEHGCHRLSQQSLFDE